MARLGEKQPFGGRLMTDTRPLDLTGQRFERLTVLRQAPNMGKRRAFLCACDCGEHVEVRSEHLRGARVRSCGCIRKEQVALLKFKHGEARKGEWSAEFTSWCAAKERCYNENHERFSYYGGRGIGMADIWRNDFVAFVAHVGRKPHPSMSLDRIDGNRDYEPGNVRWATPHEQRVNQRRMK